MQHKYCKTPHYSLFSQKSGHYLDSLAATIDTTLEEEELIADQLKEWLFGASALQAVVRRREALQVAKDEAHDALNNTFEQKEKVLQGSRNMLHLLIVYNITSSGLYKFSRKC